MSFFRFTLGLQFTCFGWNDVFVRPQRSMMQSLRWDQRSRESMSSTAWMTWFRYQQFSLLSVLN